MSPIPLENEETFVRMEQSSNFQTSRWFLKWPWINSISIRVMQHCHPIRLECSSQITRVAQLHDQAHNLSAKSLWGANFRKFNKEEIISIRHSLHLSLHARRNEVHPNDRWNGTGWGTCGGGWLAISSPEGWVVAKVVCWNVKRDLIESNFYKTETSTFHDMTRTRKAAPTVVIGEQGRGLGTETVGGELCQI